MLWIALTASCVSPPVKPTAKLSQEEVIARWHRCLESNVDHQDENTNSPGIILENTLIACQGHKRDVLATFPKQYERRLDSLMREKAYEAGFERISNRSPAGRSVSSIYQKLLTETDREY